MHRAQLLLYRCTCLYPLSATMVELTIVATANEAAFKSWEFDFTIPWALAWYSLCRSSAIWDRRFRLDKVTDAALGSAPSWNGVSVDIFEPSRNVLPGRLSSEQWCVHQGRRRNNHPLLDRRIAHPVSLVAGLPRKYIPLYLMLHRDQVVLTNLFSVAFSETSRCGLPWIKKA